MDKTTQKNIEKFHEFLKRSHQFDKALAKLASIERRISLPPCLFVLKGICLLLSSGKRGSELEEAEQALWMPLEMDPEYVPALIELGFLYELVHDKPRRAIPYFKKALAISKWNMSEVVKGLGMTLAETKSPKKARDFINQILKRPFDSNKIAETREYIKKL